MPKFNKGDKCIITNNFLCPACVGDMVEIINPICINNRVYYKVLVDGDLEGIASEKCLQLVTE